MSSSVRQQVVVSAFLAATVAALALHRSATAPAGANAASRAPKTETREAGSTGKVGVPPSASPVMARLRYTDIASPSDRRRWLIEQLRALGVPNDMLALVALEDLDVEWDGRFAACQGDADKMERVQLAKDMGRDAAMRAALGEEGFRQWDTKYMLWEAMSTAVDVTPAEADSIYGLKKKLQQRQFELDQARLNGTMDRAQVIEAIKESYSEYNRELKAVLGDERYAKSQQLDDAFIADNLRYELANVHPSDAQFQQLLQVQKNWNASFAALDQSSPHYLENFKSLNETRDQDYQRILGDDAFHALREQEDTGYIQMKKYESRWGLDDTKIDSVYDTMNQYRKAVGDYQIQVQALQGRGQNVDWTAVNNSLQQLASQTQQTLQNTVGPESFNRLQRNGVLRWAGAGFRPFYGTGPQR